MGMAATQTHWTVAIIHAEPMTIELAEYWGEVFDR